MSTDADKAGRFLSVVEVAEELGVSTKHIRRAIDRGELPAHRFRRTVRIARNDLVLFISRHRNLGPQQSTQVYETFINALFLVIT
jgi:excisionase family DNA binding protein